MPWIGGAIAAGGSILGGMFGSDSANSAAQQQAAATAAAIAEQRRQYDQTRADQAPWRAAGSDAVNRLSYLLGMGGGSGDDYGSLNKKFSLSDFWNDPVTQASYQSGLDLGTQGIKNMAGARGGRNSGQTLKALTRFGNDYTGQQAAGSQARFVGDQNNAYNRYAGVSGTGQVATQATSAAGQNASNNISGLTSSLGNARGAAAISSGNAWGGAVNGIANTYNQQSMLNKILGSGGYGNTYSNPFTGTGASEGFIDPYSYNSNYG